MADHYILRLPALELKQGSRCIYCFGVDAKRLHDFTTVSRVRRDHEQALRGYQRPEVVSHIRAIRRYLESDGAMLPNALVLAFDERVQFEPTPGAVAAVAYAKLGELIVPIDETVDDADKPAWLVDGQQRSAAIRDADVAEFPVPAVGFIADSEEDQRAQFILVNNTKPLPKGLIHELLPDTAGHLPPRYARRRVPAEIMTRLNADADSPFQGIIATPTSPCGYVKDNSILRMLENSLYEGSLYQYRNPLDGTGDVEQMLVHLKIFWMLVQRTWPDAWALSPRKSRLTHGVGIQALGFVMDALTESISAAELPACDLHTSIARLRQVVAWTNGTWRIGPNDQRRWNALQNTPNDVRLLANLLVRTAAGR